MTRCKQGENHQSHLKLLIWERHSSDCVTCNNTYEQKSKGGDQERRVRVWMMGSVVESSFETELESLKMQEPLQLARFCLPTPPLQLEDFACGTCGMVVDQPVEMMHMVCYLCVSRFPYSTESPVCPACRTTVRSTSDFRCYQDCLGSVKVKCDNAVCSITMSLRHLRAQVSICSSAPVVPPLPSSPPSSATDHHPRSASVQCWRRHWISHHLMLRCVQLHIWSNG